MLRRIVPFVVLMGLQPFAASAQVIPASQWNAFLPFTGGTLTGPLLFPDGTAGAPSIAWASDADGTGTGFYRNAANQVTLAINGNLAGSYQFIGASRLDMPSNSAWIRMGASTDAIMEREGAANFQFGTDNAAGAAVDQTISCADAITGSDISGGDCTIDTGTGMGTGAVSSFIVRTPTVAAAGANPQSLATRLTVNSTGLLIGGTTQAALGTPANGTVIYCSDCTIANPCAGAGTGALAKRLNGVWVCN